MSKAKVVLTPQARAIVKQAIANIKAKPDQFDMDHWAGKNKSPKALRTCGTSACLAGHLVLAAGLRAHGDNVSARACQRKLGFTPPITHTDPDTGREYGEISQVATKLLGVGSDVADRLYIVGNWPAPLRKQYDLLTYVVNEEGENEYRTLTPTLLKRRANLAVRRLRYFLKEGQ